MKISRRGATANHGISGIELMSYAMGDSSHALPGLALIDVALDDTTDNMPPGVIPWTHRDGVGSDDDPTQRSWIEYVRNPDTQKIVANPGNSGEPQKTGKVGD